MLTTALMLLQTAFMVGWIAVLYSGYFWIQAPLLMSMYTLDLLRLLLDTGDSRHVCLYVEVFGLFPDTGAATYVYV